MNDVLGYQGKNVDITGAASGMGRAAAQLLVDAGANVYALDIAEVMVPVAHACKVDMRHADSIDAAVPELPDRIYAVFNCAGVPSPPFPAIPWRPESWPRIRMKTRSPFSMSGP